MAYKARLTEPTTSNKYWKHISAGGKNSCILIARGSCIPNCVGYAWGRWYEIMQSKPKLSRSNAENWYGTQDGYARGKSPRLGAVVCWRKGKAGVSSDGAGHVAIVEKINPDGSIVVSESGYKAFRFRTRTLKPPYSIGGSYYFQGFIYCPKVKECTYIALTNLNFRDKPNLNGDKIDLISKGEYLTGTVDKNGWLKTTYNGKTGYVRQKGQKVYCERQ